MNNVLYIMAVVLAIMWAIGYFAYGSEGNSLFLLISAFMAVILRIIQGKKFV
ncbi:MAG: DUF5670 family protein [Bacteroidota bacterium]|nr:DUF5670 family protein [Bacteroidota bacterium]